MSNGKGSARRPMQISRDEYERRWDDAFGKQEIDATDMCKACGKPPAECGCISLDELASMMGITLFASKNTVANQEQQERA